MSYSYSARLVPAGDKHVAEDEIYSGIGSEDEETPVEVRRAIAFGREAVKNVLWQGVVGDLTKSYIVNITGHANVDNEPSPGWSNDCLTISISQV